MDSQIGHRPDHATIDVAIVEDVWDEAFAALATEFRVVREESLWRDRERLLRTVRETKILVVRNRTQVDEALIGSAPELRAIARAGSGLDNIDLEAANRAGVQVFAAPGANAASVAEHAVGLALSLVRSIPRHDARVRSGQWIREVGRELMGDTWGIVGAGSTGRATARIASAFGMRVIGYDPMVSGGGPIAGIEFCGLNQLLREAGVVSLHAPLNENTRHLINEATLSRMREDAILVNVARGELVDEVALTNALSDGVIAGAGLDVREMEPPAKSPLLSMSNVVFTPHVAGMTADSQRRIAAILTSQILDLLRVDAG